MFYKLRPTTGDKRRRPAQRPSDPNYRRGFETEELVKPTTIVADVTSRPVVTINGDVTVRGSSHSISLVARKPFYEKHSHSAEMR